MGCDIHAFVEYKYKSSERWRSFGKEFRLDRIYGMFAKMAGVRNYSGTTPISEPRGIPEDIGSAAFDGLCYYITDDPLEDEPSVTTEKATIWVEKYGCKYMRKSFVTNPDYHSHSWLNTAELDECVKSVWNEDYNGHETECVAIVCMMKSLESSGYETRIVFWFDN